MDSDEIPAWKRFEKEVVAALQRIDPAASVEWNKRVLDVRTGSPRQIDAWIQARVCGHTIKIVGSCKHLGKKVDASDIDHLNGEIRAVGAQSGMIFSKMGFADTALAAAKADGLSCCLLVAGQPVKFESLPAYRQFLIKPEFAITLFGRAASKFAGTWAEFAKQMDAKDPSPGEFFRWLTERVKKTIGEALEARGNWGNHKLTPGYAAMYLEIGDETDHTKLEILVNVRIFESLQEATLADGVINVTQGTFLGQVAGPSIDTVGNDPGPGWKELSQPPIAIDRALLAMVFSPDPSPEDLLAHYGSRAAFDAVASEAAEARLKSRAQPLQTESN